ncbi:MAG: hypothetical protein AAB215_00975 [Planctomycetota bacterium]
MPSGVRPVLRYPAPYPEAIDTRKIHAAVEALTGEELLEAGGAEGVADAAMERERKRMERQARQAPKELLRLQVRDFAEWLKGQGLLR